MNADIIGVWVAALLTLCIFSFLYKDNPIYKFAEHLFVGVSAGYLFAQDFNNVLIPNVWSKLPWKATADKLILNEGFSITLFTFLEKFGPIFAAVLGILILLKLVPKASWISRWPIAFIVGTTAGLAIRGQVIANIIAQVKATMVSFFVPGDWLLTVNYWLIFIGVFCGLIYFYFSKEHKGIFWGGASRIGIWFLMTAFGAAFGYTVMARVALLTGRMQFLLGDWLHLIR